MARDPVQGRWDIVEMEMWERDALDLVEPAHLAFEKNGMGGLAFIAVGAGIDYRVSEADGELEVEFCWEGVSEGEQVSGRGRATVKNDEMRGDCSSTPEMTRRSWLGVPEPRPAEQADADRRGCASLLIGMDVGLPSRSHSLRSPDVLVSCHADRVGSLGVQQEGARGLDCSALFPSPPERRPSCLTRF